MRQYIDEIRDIIGDSEISRIDRWSDYVNKYMHSDKQLSRKDNERNRDRQAILLLDNQKINEHTMYVLITGVVLQQPHIPPREITGWSGVNYALTCKCGLAFEFEQGKVRIYDSKIINDNCGFPHVWIDDCGKLRRWRDTPEHIAAQQDRENKVMAMLLS